MTTPTNTRGVFSGLKGGIGFKTVSTIEDGVDLVRLIGARQPKLTAPSQLAISSTEAIETHARVSPCSLYAKIYNAFNCTNAQSVRRIHRIQRDSVTSRLSLDTSLTSKSLCLFIVSIALYSFVGGSSSEELRVMSFSM